MTIRPWLVAIASIFLAAGCGSGGGSGGSGGSADALFAGPLLPVVAYDGATASVEELELRRG